MDKDVTHTHNGILAIKRMKAFHLRQLDRSTWYYAKRNKSDRERQTPYDLTYMLNLKNNINKRK